ncbi:MAG: PBSX family phage terminase large subunit [Oscillospiraceae bacterium]
MKFKTFSKKQRLLLTWWCDNSKLKNYDAVIADGAVRSGKTLCMSISFVCWAFHRFNNQSFAFCGKTITSLKRNVIFTLLNALQGIGFTVEYKVSKNYLDITYKGKSNRFYLFGGKDESSAALIQGITLAGIMLDEVALMPRGFVEQALARCSVCGSKFFFNCNPEHPFHWFYLEWIKKCKEKNALYLHFSMTDNPSLTKEILQRYENLYTGAFYERFILGKWVAAMGLVYPMFYADKHIVFTLPEKFSKYYISCDYGTVNPTSMGLWGESNGKWYRIKEYYYSARDEKQSKTDEEHYLALKRLAADKKIEAVIVDPSAASFIECILRYGSFKVIRANNDVLGGIQKVSTLLNKEALLFYHDLPSTFKEFSVYCWSNRGDFPKKENDHAMDDIRYFVSTVLEEKDDDFFVVSQKRI